MKLHNIKEKDMLDQAIEALRQTAGLDIEVVQYEPAAMNARADAYVNIAHNNKNYEFVVEVKNVDRFATVAQVKNQLEEFNKAPLLIAPKLTEAAADNCKELGLNFIDLAGNAYINELDFFILIKGQKLDQNQNNLMNYFKGNKALTPTNLRMVFALLCKPELLNAPYREIAKVAGIALGAVGWGFNDLAIRGFTLGEGKRNDRVFIQAKKLIQEWVTNYPIKLRPKLNPKRFKANNLDWWKNLDVKNYNAQWGGEVAADKLTNYLKPNFFILYLHGKDMKKNMSKLIVDNRLVPDPNGDIEILEAYWDFDDAEFLPETVPALLVYADLVASNDPRNLEVAKMVHDRFIPYEYH
ncbi:MAG TPA: type IV toxin-antitoxin system AbiEi family antitoxin [Methylotenera sp.]|nr:type IV toxin-antitoxin system AbiEi family antitoxin [Methylotenera sp.]